MFMWTTRGEGVTTSSGEQNAAPLIADELRAGMANGEFWLALQPKVDAETSGIIGVEALLRWDHPTRGAVSPGEFIPVAEQSGLMAELGLWVLRRSADLAIDLARRPALGHLTVSVNVSDSELLADDFVANVNDVLGSTGVDPASLFLEISEEALAVDSQLAAKRLMDLGELGMAISVDGFGIGYGSLDRVLNFPIRELKVARHFVTVAAIPESRGLAVMRSVASLGRSLGLSVVAEGVETAEELEAVRAAGVDGVQGYWFGRPVSHEKLIGLFDRSIAGSASPPPA